MAAEIALLGLSPALILSKTLHFYLGSKRDFHH